MAINRTGSELWITEVKDGWAVRRPDSGEVLGTYEGRAEATQEARKIAQREPDTSVKMEHRNGTVENVPLLGRDPIAEKG